MWEISRTQNRIVPDFLSSYSMDSFSECSIRARYKRLGPQSSQPLAVDLVVMFLAPGEARGGFFFSILRFLAALLRAMRILEAVPSRKAGAA